MGKKVDIKLKCKRKDVKVNTFKQTERSKPYFNMDPMEKKVFALNMVTGGSWSRIKGKVVRIKYKKSKSKKPGNDSALTIDISLPEKMKNRQLDIFAIQMDPRNRKVDISMANRTVDHQVELTIKKRKINCISLSSSSLSLPTVSTTRYNPGSTKTGRRTFWRFGNLMLKPVRAT